MAFCPKCGAGIQAGDAFCMSCGNKLDAPEQETAAQPTATAAPAATTPMAAVPVATTPQPSVAPMPAAAPVAAAPVAARAAATGSGVGRDQVILWVTLAAGAVYAIGALLPWIKGAISVNAFDVPLMFLVDFQNTGGLGLGYLVVVVGLAGAYFAFKGPVIARRIAGGVGIAIVGLVAFQLQRAAEGTGVSAGDFYGFAMYLCLLAGIALAIAPSPSGATTSLMPGATASTPAAYVPPPTPAPAPVPAATAPVWSPTHRVTGGPLPAWDVPNPTSAAVANLDDTLEVTVTERMGDWARVLCSNGWSGWVDGRRLAPK